MKINSMKYCIYPLMVLLLSACAHRPVIYMENGHKKLVRRIRQTIKKSKLLPNMGMHVVSLKTGEELYNLNAQQNFMPASNNKIFTATAALKILTPQHEFFTSIWIDSLEINRDTLSAITIVGGGDPDFMPDQLNRLALEIAGKYHWIDSIFVDNFYFDDIPYGEGWMWDDGSGWYSAQVNSMTLNDNCVDIILNPGGLGEPPIVNVFPDVGFVTIINSAVTVNDTVEFKELSINRRWMENSNIIDIKGEILIDDEEIVYYTNIENPALFTGTVLKDYLIQAGVQIWGGVSIKKRASSDTLIFKYNSKPLISSIMNFLKESDNLTGETLVKAIGRKTTGKQGTWMNGLTAIKTLLNDEVGLDTTGFVMVDGSGVSRYNLTSPENLTTVLSYLYHDFTISSEFETALPTGGWDGTLSERMNEEYGRNIHAKTGTLRGVSCLSGYAITNDNEPLTFSIMMNGYIGEADSYQKLQDDLAKILVEFSR